VPPTAHDDRLTRLGWDHRWAEELAAVRPGAEPARVTQHHGAGLVLALAEGERQLMFTQRLSPEPTVGDWVAVDGDEVVAVLPRRSLLRRRAAHGEGEQALAANVDVVLLVCGLDRPVKDGRIQRGTAIAHDAGAVPVVVLTKAARGTVTIDADGVAGEVRAAHPGVEVLLTSVKEGVGLDDLRRVVGAGTVTLLGESGAGKSSIVNALLGDAVAAVGDVREGDAKGRHTTTGREMHLLDGGGVLIDTPGIRAVGLVTDTDAVAETFTDVDEVAASCRFADCQHDGQPGCALGAAVEAGELSPERVAAWQRLHAEADAAARRASPHEQRRHERRSGRAVKDAQRRKGRS
jgi:ribosome biogenesis GTPase